MIIGVPKEIKLQEHRIGLTPDSVKVLYDKGHKVLIETNAGLEAGFTDGDGDGILGNSPVEVNSEGKVIGTSDGYTIPVDNNFNGTKDYLEPGIEIDIISLFELYNFLVEFDTLVLNTEINSGDFTYEWQTDDLGLDM